MLHLLCGLPYSEDGVCVEGHKGDPKEHAQAASHIANKTAKAIQQDIPHNHISRLDTKANTSKFHPQDIPNNVVLYCVLFHLILIILAVWEAAGLGDELWGTV